MGNHNENYLITNVESGKITCRADEIPYYHTNYETAQKMSQKMYDTNYVGSGLITGTQWDVMLKWISTQSDYADLKSDSNWGNYLNLRTYTDCTGKYLEINYDGSHHTEWKDSDGTNNNGYATLLTTGSTNEVRKKNLYDVAGNLWEWTEESASTSGNYYTIRGGGYCNLYQEYPVCYRWSYDKSSAHTPIGFRPVLNIK